MKKAEQEREENMKENELVKRLKLLKEKIVYVSSDVANNKRKINEKSNKIDKLEEQVAKLLDTIRDLSYELYECFGEIKITEDEMIELKDLCDELIEEEEN